MIKIGVIGDIGSGKSFVSKLLNYPVFDADKEVIKIYKKDKSCYKKLRKKLPKYVFSFPIKKKELGNAIINNFKNIREISNIVHPLIKIRLKKFLEKYKKNRIVVLDIPLLLENKINEKEYVLVFVDAKKSDILKRLKKRPNYNSKTLAILKKFQLPIEIKKKKSNYIIKNNFKRLNLKKNVKILKIKILNNERNCS